MIFIDVGSHEGQTLEEVTRDCYRWTTIFSFEPAHREYIRLTHRFGAITNLRLINAALWGFDGPGILYGANDKMEASLFPQHQDVDDSVQQEVQVLDAADFFKRRVHEHCVMKLNCEGAEIGIIDRLIDSGEIDKIHHMLIDFDARKVKGNEREPARIRQRLAKIDFRRYIDHWPTGGTHQERVAAWLGMIPGL